VNRNTVTTVLILIAAVVIAWFLVNVLFGVLWFIAKLAIVAVVALIVYVALRAMLGSGREG